MCFSSIGGGMAHDGKEVHGLRCLFISCFLAGFVVEWCFTLLFHVRHTELMVLIYQSCIETSVDLWQG